MVEDWNVLIQNNADVVRNAVDLAFVQTKLKKDGLAWYYIDQLTWRRDGNIIKAYPRWPLSQTAFNVIKKAFKKLGGKFVSHHGKAWFELVLKAEESGFRRISSEHTPQGTPTSKTVSPAPESALIRMQAQLDRLVAAGHECLRER